MKTRKTRKDLVAEALRSSRRHLLKEEGEVVPTKPAEEGGDSLDTQVDRYLGEYETEAKTAKVEGRDFRMLTRRLLSEAGEDEEEVGAGQLTLDDIDVESFANGVARLIDNYDSLLEVRNTLLRRAKSFLKKGYDEKVGEAFESIMRDRHGVEDGKTPREVGAEDEVPPAADRAGAGDIGGVAGGGA